MGGERDGRKEGNGKGGEGEGKGGGRGDLLQGLRGDRRPCPHPLRGLLPVVLLGEQRHDGCEQFA